MEFKVNPPTGLKKSVKSIVQTWLDTALGFFYPEVCSLCEQERASARSGFVCHRCWSQVCFIQPPFCKRCGLPYPGDLTTPFECANCREIKLYFKFARSAVVARGIVMETIHRYKYQRALWFEPFLTDMLLREALPTLHDQNWDFIVPVPLHSVKEREREFNQAERLARRLSDATKIPTCQRWLRRISPTATQTRFTRQQRAANMRRAFAVRKGVRLHGARIILVDDVFTTGATTNACAKALRVAGAGDIGVWTVARGL